MLLPPSLVRSGVELRLELRTPVRREWAIISQEQLLLPDLTLAENVFIGGQPRGGGRVDWRAMDTHSSPFCRRSRNMSPRDPVRHGRMLPNESKAKN